MDALLTHPKVKAISFVGSTPVARHIYETGTQHGKRVQANGGAKNYVAAHARCGRRELRARLIEAAFGCAGERCMAGSTALAVGAAAKRCCRRWSKRRGDQSRPDRSSSRSRTWGRSSPRQHRDRVAAA